MNRRLLVLVFGAILGACGDDASTSTSIEPLAATYATWAAVSQDAMEPLPFPNAPMPVLRILDDQTLRQVVRISAGGEQLRVRLSNRFGPEAITFEHAAVALSQGGSAIEVGSQVPLTFADSARVTVPVGQEVWSDFVAFPTESEQSLAITLYSAGASAMGTAHSLGRQTTYLTEGDVVDAPMLPSEENPPTSYYWLNAIDVGGARAHRVVVAFGDSITDGFNSTLDENHRYPNYLSQLLTSASASEPFSVVNAGISGNRVLSDAIGPSGLSRFNHDALEPTGVQDLVILLGINDIGFGVFNMAQDVSATQITGGLAAMLTAARERGLRVHLSTLLPFSGAGYSSEDGEAKRTAVNGWVRSGANATAVIDFDTLMAAPNDPLAMKPGFDSGDHLHPNDTGYEAMAGFVRSSLVK